MLYRYWSVFRPFWGLTLTVVFVAILFGAFSWGLDDNRIRFFLKNYGLACLVGSIVLCVFSLYQCVGRGRLFKRFIWVSRAWPSLLVWGLCSLHVISLYKPGYRTLMDEVVVLATSKAIHEDREPLTPTGFDYVMGVKRLSMAYIDKRPYLFAWIASVMHDLRGYSVDNVFWVNRVLGCLALALVGTAGWFFSNRRQSGAIVAMVALSAVTLFAQHVSGGGIDVLNIVCLLGVLLCAGFYVSRPDTSSFRLLLGVAVLAAYARYESVIYLAIPVILLAWRWRVSRKIDLDWAGSFYVVTVFPLAALHYLTFSSSEQSFQLIEKKLDRAFSFSYMFGNLGHAWSFFTDQDHLLTNSTLVFWGGLISCVGLIIVSFILLRSGRPQFIRASGVFWLFCGFIVAGFLLLMCYAWGDVTQPIASRLTLPLYVLFALCLGIAAAAYSASRRVAVVVCLVLVFSMYWSSHRLASKDYHTKMYSSQQRISRFDEFIKSQSNTDFAVVNGVGIFWLTRDIVSVYPGSLKSNPAFLCNMLKSRVYDRVFWVEELKKSPASGEFVTVPGDVLPSELKVVSKVVWEIAGGADMLFRFHLIESATVDDNGELTGADSAEHLVKASASL